MRLITGYRLSQMVHVAATLGIADLLASGPKGCAELAQLSGTHAPSLYRALRALAGAGIFREQADGRFALNALAEPLRSDVPGSVRGYAIMQGEGWIWDAWGRALHSVRTGEPAFNHLHGTDFFPYLEQHPEAAAIFNAGMTGRAASADVAVAHTYDFSDVRTIIDVGGGHGLLLSAILEAYPAARGILLDLPSVAAGARERIAAAGLAEHCEVVGGDFFAAVPTGGDCYVLANVIHDWDDDRAVAILRNCQRAMAPGGRVLIIEAVLPTGNEPHPGKIGDLQMLVISGGRERTEAEYRALLAASDFRPARVIPTASPVSVVEGIRE
jgi:SAM-dependent methyltransferase